MFRSSRCFVPILLFAVLAPAPAQTRRAPNGRAAADLDAIARLPHSRPTESGAPAREGYEPERALRRRYAAASRRQPVRRAETVTPPTRPAAAPVFTGFQGLPDNFRAIPPDTMGAVGPQHVLTMLNTQVLIQNRTGTSRQNYPITLAAFWSPLGAFPDIFDPRIQYDPQADRWIAVAAANGQLATSALLVAVSRTGDPGGTWNYFKVTIGNANQWGDFPVLGFNANWIVVSVNLFGIRSGDYIHTGLYVFGKTDLYQNGTGAFTAFTDALGELTPAQDYDNRSPNTLYLVQTLASEFVANPDTSAIRISRLQGAVGFETFRGGNGGTITVQDPWSDSASDGEEFGPQAGSTEKIDAGDSRLTNCALRGGTVWCAHTVYVPAGKPTRTAAQWFQFDPAAARPALLQLGRVQDPADRFFYAFPSIAVNKNNDALIAYTRFGTSDYPSAAFSFRASADPPNTMQQEILLKAGQSSYVNPGARSGSNRWGDYSATVVDPSNDVDFWALQEYAAAPPAGRTGAFGTWWAQVFPPLAGPTCTYSLSSTSATFDATGGTGPVQVATAAGCTWQAASNTEWIEIASPAAGSGPATVRFIVSAATAPRSGSMTIAGTTFTVTQTGPGTAPVFTAIGIVNAASFTTGAIAPGELITIFGANLGPAVLQTAAVIPGQLGTTAGGTRVLFDGTPAPMIYAAERQLAAIVPFAIQGRGTVQVQVTYQGEASAPQAVAVTAAAPAIFTAASSGKGQGAVLNQDFAVNSDAAPAARGSAVLIYATGGGAMTLAALDGRIATPPLAGLIQSVAVRIGGIDAPISYAGAAPGLVNGVLQINATVPGPIAPGPAVPVELIIGGVPSPAGVTIAVR